MSYRAELQAGQTVELFGRIYSWRQKDGRWSLESDRLESPRQELLSALARHEAQAQAAAGAELGAARRAARNALPPHVQMLVLDAAIARARAAQAGDPAWKPPGTRLPTYIEATMASRLVAEPPASQPGQAAS